VVSAWRVNAIRSPSSGMLITETDRLILRHFHILDAVKMERVFCDPEVMQFSSGVKSPQWVEQWLRGCLENYFQKWGFGLWAVVNKRLSTRSHLPRN
jgi:RimJ/RimL family protein N-acetyltransferase